MLSKSAGPAAGVGPLQRDTRQAALVRQHMRSARAAPPAQAQLHSAATNEVEEETLAATSPRPQPVQEQLQPSSTPDDGEAPPSGASPSSPQGLERLCSGSAIQPATLAEAPFSDAPDAARSQMSAVPLQSTSNILQAVSIVGPIVGLEEEISDAKAEEPSQVLALASKKADSQSANTGAVKAAMMRFQASHTSPAATAATETPFQHKAPATGSAAAER